VQALDSCEWRSVKRRACAYSTSDRTARKKIDSCKVWGTYVPSLVKIGPQITSHSCPQTPDGRTDGRLRDFIFCPMHMHSIGQTIKRWCWRRCSCGLRAPCGVQVPRSGDRRRPAATHCRERAQSGGPRHRWSAATLHPSSVCFHVPENQPPGSLQHRCKNVFLRFLNFCHVFNVLFYFANVFFLILFYFLSNTCRPARQSFVYRPATARNYLW